MVWPLILGAAATGLQLYGQAESADGLKEAGRYNAAVLRERAADVDAVIADVQYVGQQQAMDLRSQRMQQKGSGRAGFASAGVIVSHGSAGVWERGLEGQTAQDLNRLQANVNRDVASLRSSQKAILQEATFEEWRGDTGAAAQYVGMGSTLLGGAANFMSNYNRMYGG